MVVQPSRGDSVAREQNLYLGRGRAQRSRRNHVHRTRFLRPASGAGAPGSPERSVVVQPSHGDSVARERISTSAEVGPNGPVATMSIGHGSSDLLLGRELPDHQGDRFLGVRARVRGLTAADRTTRSPEPDVAEPVVTCRCCHRAPCAGERRAAPRPVVGTKIGVQLRPVGVGEEIAVGVDGHRQLLVARRRSTSIPARRSRYAGGRPGRGTQTLRSSSASGAGRRGRRERLIRLEGRSTAGAP